MGIFQAQFTTYKYGATLVKFINDHLLPSLGDLQKLTVDISRYKRGNIDTFFGRRLYLLEREFEEKNKNFMILYNIYNNPDKLFADFKLDPIKDEQKISVLMDEYERNRAIIERYFDQGFRLLEVSGRLIFKHYEWRDKRLIIIISFAAITISVIAITL